MTAATTVVFADLTGSTRVFEALGNEEATRAITALTQWIADVSREEGGRVVKTLGDGVLVLFPSAEPAVEAVVRLQREHARRRSQRGAAARLQLQVGLACGEVVDVDGDCYGDAVNVASRLSDLSGGRQIWATAAVVEQLELPPPGVRFFALGPVPIRGKAEPQNLFRIEWREDTSTDMMTLPGFTASAAGAGPRGGAQGGIELRFLDQAQTFALTQLPVQIGRVREAEFVVQDPRVSRLHARIEWRNDSLVLEDLSSFGTCVRFDGAPTELRLRRDHCVLHDSGEIALGADFGDWSVPTIQFALKMK